MQTSKNLTYEFILIFAILTLWIARMMFNIIKVTEKIQTNNNFAVTGAFEICTETNTFELMYIQINSNKSFSHANK